MPGQWRPPQLFPCFFAAFFCAFVLSVAVTYGQEAVLEPHHFNVDSSIAKEGVSSLTLLCNYAPRPNETIYLVTWSKVREDNDVTVIFRKHLKTTSGANYTFFGSWNERKAQHNDTTLADVILGGGNVTRDDVGVYRCQVSSDNGTIYNDTAVKVLYGPGTSIQINSSHSGSFRLLEGETITLMCTADCLPSCSFRWTCAGCVATREAKLTVSNIQRDQSGVYTCLAYNIVSRGRTDVTLDVLYPAYVRALYFADGEQTLQVEEGRGVTISCQATGNPPPYNITWSVSGQSKDNQTFSMRYGHDRSSVYMLSAASCHDNDKYTCTTTNGMGPDIRSVSLQVLCAPVPDKECVQRENVAQVAKFSQTANITFCVVARPRPSVLWYHELGDVGAVVIEDFDVTYDEVLARLETWVSFASVGEDTYGVYRVVIENDRGAFVENFTLISKEPPQAPRGVTVYNVTMTSFCLTWTAGFNGGRQQTFVLTYSTRNGDVQSKRYRDFIPACEGHDVIKYCAEDLEPGILYDVILSAENAYGTTEESAVVLNVTTTFELNNGVSERLTARWVEVGVPLGTGFLLLAAVVLVFICKRLHWTAAPVVENTRTKQTTPLCFTNENVRLSYLGPARQGSYIDATSLDVISDVTARRLDVNRADRAHSMSLLEVPGRRLGVDELSRRPSSTPSYNIYLDILGEPSTYVNQDDNRLSSASTNTAETHDTPTTENTTTTTTTAATNRHERSSQHVQPYINMDGDADPEAENRNSESEDVSLESSDYDDSWSALANYDATDMATEKCSFYEESAGVNAICSPACSATGASIPTITVTEERGGTNDGVSRNCPKETEAGTMYDDDDHIYDVIRDSDVEDAVF